MATTDGWCRLCKKSVAAKERRLLGAETSRNVLSCLLALRSGTSRQDLVPDTGPRSVLCKLCFAEVERLIRFNREVDNLRSSLCQKLDSVLGSQQAIQSDVLAGSGQEVHIYMRSKICSTQLFTAYNYIIICIL